MQEIWKPIPGYEECYEVSNLGQVKSCDRAAFTIGGSTRRVRERILKRSFDKDGYPVVSVSNGLSAQVTWKVHRLVLLAFVGSLPEGLESLHADGVPTNCALSNLSYGTGIGNWQDRRKHGRDVDGRSNPNAKLTSEQILQIKQLSGTITYAEIGRRFNISDVHAGRICKGLIK